MAKRNNGIDQTPIEFRIPNSVTKGPRIPIPINQPHWRYKIYRQTRPTIVEWGLVIFFALLIFTIGILILFSSNLTPAKWILSIGLICISAGFVHHLYWREKNHQANHDQSQEEKQIRKKEKKQPKHRKDYK